MVAILLTQASRFIACELLRHPKAMVCTGTTGMDDLIIVLPCSIREGKLLLEMILFRERAAGFTSEECRVCMGMFARLQPLVAEAESLVKECEAAEQRKAA